MSIFCIVPPDMLSEIAKNGNPSQRDAAIDTLALDAGMRAQRKRSVKTPGQAAARCGSAGFQCQGNRSEIWRAG
jgi:hypothetical protein